MSELPEGWVRGLLSDVLRIRNGYAFKSAEFKLDGVPLVRQSNLDGDKVDLSKCAYLDEQYLIERASFTLHKGDVLIGMSGSVGKLCTYDQDFAALQNQRVGKIELHAHDQTEWRFVWHYLKTVTDALLDKAKGVAVANVSPDDIHSLPLNVPPLAEQTRIAQKLDELLAQVDTLKARIDAIPALLKRFRQSVLAAAVSGRLTEEWRTQNVGWVDEGSSTTTPKRDDDCWVSQAQPNLRPGWSSLPVNSLCTAAFDGPFGSKLKSDDYTSEGARVVRLENIGHLSFISEKKTFIGSAKLAELSKNQLETGDILFSSFVDEEIRVCRLPRSEEIFINKADCFCLRIDESTADPTFMMYALAAKQTYQRIKESVHGATRPRINLGFLKSFELSVPSHAEQAEIVRRVEQLFAFADQLEAKVASAKSRIDHLTQSILAKAFRGELAPQDPNDEPASVLLERIQAQRAAAPKAKRGSKKSESTLQAANESSAHIVS